VVADTAGKWPYLEDLTADFLYLRLHGDQELYASGYTPAALDRWADRIRAWLRGSQPTDASTAAARSSAPPAPSRDVYCYFDNDRKVHAPFDAHALHARLSGMPVTRVRGRRRSRPSDLVADVRNFLRRGFGSARNATR